MGRNVTAIYRTHAVADLVRQELEAIGLSRGDIHIIPDQAQASGGDYQSHDDRLHDLHLPENDLRTYQNCVRRGDFVVSAEVADDGDIANVQKIMRRPEDEAYNLDLTDSDYADQTVYPRSDADPYTNLRGGSAERDPAYTDPYVRSYRRGAL